MRAAQILRSLSGQIKSASARVSLLNLEGNYRQLERSVVYVIPKDFRLIYSAGLADGQTTTI